MSQFTRDALDNPVYTSDRYYDLFDGGYIKPEKMLTNEEDIHRVLGAISLISDFLEEAENQGAIVVE